MTRTRRRLAIGTAVVFALVLVVMAGLHLVVRQMQSRIEAALGPRASIGAINAGWTSIDVLDLRIKGAAGWPAEDELRAQRVQVMPDLRSLFGGPWRIAKVRVEGGYMSALRTRDGKMRLLPALLDERGAKRGSTHQQDHAAPPLLEIGQVELAAARLDFFDGSVRLPALQLRIGQLDVAIGPLILPALDQATQIKLDGVFKGVQRDGRIAIDGSFTPDRKSTRLNSSHIQKSRMPSSA